MFLMEMEQKRNRHSKKWQAINDGLLIGQEYDSVVGVVRVTPADKSRRVKWRLNKCSPIPSGGLGLQTPGKNFG